MFYQNELDFLQLVFSKCRLQLLVLDPSEPVNQRVDMGLRRMLGLDDHYGKILQTSFMHAENNVIYRVTDPFSCRYMYFLLPDVDRPAVAVVGPYLSERPTHEQLMEEAERHGLQSRWFGQIEQYFGNIPVIDENSPVFAMLDAFAEKIWGGSDTFTVVDIDREQTQEGAAIFAGRDSSGVQDELWNMENLERRYAYENELLQAVAQGQVHKAELLMAGLGNLTLERRLADPVRNLKNYCIIMNTLLRKAAEQGGVHPLYLDRISSEFARKIESLTTAEAVGALIEQMYRDYCRLVRKNNTTHYSPPVQKALMHIDLNLSGELNLKILAGMQNINASYLSALFKKETGQTLTDHINQKRIQQAVRLLTTTKLQVQTVAQHCGFSDVNYFSKLFKKYTGMTPNEYRKESRRGTR